MTVLAVEQIRGKESSLWPTNTASYMRNRSKGQTQPCRLKRTTLTLTVCGILAEKTYMYYKKDSITVFINTWSLLLGVQFIKGSNRITGQLWSNSYHSIKRTACTHKTQLALQLNAFCTRIHSLMVSKINRTYPWSSTAKTKDNYCERATETPREHVTIQSLYLLKKFNHVKMYKWNSCLTSLRSIC